MAKDPDKDFILEDIKHGFRLTDTGQVIKPVECDNYVSGTRPDGRERVQRQLQQDIDAGLLITTPHKPTIVNALGAVPKEGSDELRLVTDASRPRGASWNSYMSLNSFTFDNVDTALKLGEKDIISAKLTCAVATGVCPFTRMNISTVTPNGTLISRVNTPT